jgi:hypothetical protein
VKSRADNTFWAEHDADGIDWAQYRRLTDISGALLGDARID